MIDVFTREKKNYCPNLDCKIEILEPILINNLSTNPAKKYLGCKICFYELKKNHLKLWKIPTNKHKKNKKESPKSCKNFFGYLSKKPKGISTPTECLVCRKLVDCTLKSNHN
jgi:hypothetical protein